MNNKARLYKIGSKIYKDNNYKEILWLCGFVKTSLSNALFVIGITLIFNGLSNHPHFKGNPSNSIIFGFVSFILGLIVIYLIDKKRETLKKIEYGRNDENIDLKIYYSQLEHESEIEDLIKHTAEERVESAMKRELRKIRLNNDKYKESEVLSQWEKDVLE